jgi:aminoglycoside/choline kinase family phosphotransferase
MAFDADQFEQAIAATLAAAGFAGATRTPLPQDASTRSYVRLRDGDRRAMLMLAPPGAENPPCPPLADEAARDALGWNAQSRLAASRVEAFVAVAGHLRGHGFSAPQVLAADAQAGVAVIEDLGDALYADEIKAGADEIALYAAAGALLADLHAIDCPRELPSPAGPWPILDFDRMALRVNADLFVEWGPVFLGRPAIDASARADWDAIRDDLIGEALALPRAFTLRDYHAENILWLPERAGRARVGLLDFQDAVRGFRGWDFAMLLHDARRDVSPAAHEACVRAYLDASGGERAAFDAELDLLGALNALRILGIFSRLAHRDGKRRYTAFMPREAGHLRAILARPRLRALAAWIARHAPLDGFEAAA